MTPAQHTQNATNVRKVVVPPSCSADAVKQAATKLAHNMHRNAALVVVKLDASLTVGTTGMATVVVASADTTGMDGTTFTEFAIAMSIASYLCCSIFLIHTSQVEIANVLLWLITLATHTQEKKMLERGSHVNHLLFQVTAVSGAFKHGIHGLLNACRNGFRRW